MSEQNTQPTIAELWRQFDKNWKHWIGKDYSNGIPENYGMLQVREAEALRAQLLERCKEVRDVDGDVTSLWVCGHNDKLSITCPGILDFVGKPFELRELAAALSFWAWELEQREKEATPPPVIP